ncbi:SDR family NAD(P)-dependent oxidoreductase [Brevundimonas vesicularis]|uniref:SDR family NAD(P)-dependent oxidoreductase n=1 Tax=Brevundimonas vesicularis TaxID=41276 RepID=UPI0038D3BA66
MTQYLLNATGKVLLLSGAWGGVGQAIMTQYVASGGAVIALDRAAGPSTDQVTSVICDVTQEDEVKAAVEGALKDHDHIDAVVHAAGIVGSGQVQDTRLEDWHRVMDANLTSAFLLARATHCALKASRGSMILLGSTNGFNGGSPLSGAAYASAKAALSNLGRHLAKTWSPEVRVNVVAPGPVATPMLDRLDEDVMTNLKASLLTGELIQADEVAAAVAFLISDNARSITGTTLNLSGGLVLN